MHDHDDTDRGNVHDDRILIDEREHARLFGRSVATIRTERSRGRGPGYIKLDRRVLYDLAELRRWYAARHVRHTAEAHVRDAAAKARRSGEGERPDTAPAAELDDRSTSEPIPLRRAQRDTKRTR